MAADQERRDRILTALTGASEALHGLSADERAANPEGADLLERAIAYVEIVVRQTDSALITESALNSLVAQAEQVPGDPAAAVANARAYADNLLQPASVLPPSRDRDVEQAVKDAAANFQRSATHRLKALSSEVDRYKKEIDVQMGNVRTKVDEGLSEATTRTDSQAADFTGKLAAFETTLTKQRQAVSQALERQSDAFSQTQEERAETFQSDLKKARDEIAAMLKASRGEVDARIAEIRRMEEEASGLVHSTGLGLTAERYGEEAVEQRKVADRYRWMTVLLALGAVAVAIYAIVDRVDDPSAVAAKLGVSLVLGAVAAYTAKQSGRHRRREERSRDLQLQLTAFAPFIEPLDDDIKTLERVLMTRKTFGNVGMLPDADADHRYGPLGPALEEIQKRLFTRSTDDR